MRTPIDLAVKELTITVEQIGYVEATAFAELVVSGECAWQWPLDASHEGQALSPPEAAATCLVLDDSKSSYFMEFEPVADLNLVLDCSRLVHYRQGRLVQAVEGSLREIIQRRRQDGFAGHEPIATPRLGGRDGYQNAYTEAVVATWATQRRLLGQLAVCTCGIPGCGATYAWMEDGQCLLLVEVSAAGIARFEVGPFRLKSS